MKRKLFSVMLCAFALLLLMGAAVNPEQAAALVTEEESILDLNEVLETDVQSLNKVNNMILSSAIQASLVEQAKENNIDVGMRINGEYAPADLGRVNRDGVTYVSLSAMAGILDETAQSSWNESARTLTIVTSQMTVKATADKLYLEANGRYIYLPDGVMLVDGSLSVPLWAVAKIFDAAVSWDGVTGTVQVTRGSGAIQSGDSYYDADVLFWLSRVIYAESGNQSLEGKMAVGNVVMNRVESSRFPNTVKGVLSQKNQFSTYKNGKLANRTPNESSVIAAKLVLDGGVVEECEGALYFDSASRSWASRNRECIAVIGGHKFYL